MNRIRRIAYILFIVSVATGHITSQFKSPLGQGVDPFSIKPGSTFSASGGSPGGGTETNSRPSGIAADIREAEELIGYNHINGRSLSVSELTKTALAGMLHVLDPHSNYYDSAEWKELLDDQRSGYSGIGATIANFEKAGIPDTYVLSTFPGSPAAKSQLRFGDRIVAINGEKMTGKNSDVVRDKIRGGIGTTFRLTVERAATNRLETIEIRRNRVPQPSIPDAYILRPGIGYIDLSEGFNYTTAEEFDVAMHELKAAGMKSLILDLRGNGGGIVDQAVKIAERFLPSGTLILTQRGRARIDNRDWKSSSKIPDSLPLVVLVNQETASASEIVAGAFQDHDRAMIVGDKTFGKGLVQSVINLPDSAGLTLTTGRYLTPSGRSIQRDYSRGGLYDYFSHKTPADEIDLPYFEARTITNRRVFGGDGIQPDETVKSSPITPEQVSLLDPIFFFSRELANGRIPGSELIRADFGSNAKRITPEDFPISDTLLTSFQNYIVRNPVAAATSEVVERESAFIKTRIRYNVVMALYGTVTANQVLIENDSQVAKAVDLLPRSGQLAQHAAKLRRK